MKFKSFLYGAIVGALAGIFLAPESGRRSRALVKDKAVKYSKDTAEFVDKKSRHIANKAKGYAHDVKGLYGRVAGHAIEEMEEETPVEA